MPTTRITESSRKILHELAKRDAKSMQEILEKAIENYRRQCILEESNSAFAALKSSSKAWHAEQEERALWDITASDGLKEE